MSILEKPGTAPWTWLVRGKAQSDHLRPIVDAIGDGVHCHWIASNKITAEVDLLQAIQLCIKRGNLQFTSVKVT